ncbi:hypothetical protein Pan241w_13030 [Gimesia alba]|uniref:Uncharacterized protein n=1 Tax=Gimesia alba TaxID=2527973 RepID=A0A517RBL9_9PLAN|nr:hypothetical protein Pan241w_13030 [Gimesia alba]
MGLRKIYRGSRGISLTDSFSNRLNLCIVNKEESGNF